MARILSCGSPLRVPAPARELAEDDEVASVVGHDLPVAAAQRALRPPAVLDEPGLAHRLDRSPADRLGPAAGPGPDLDGTRCGEAARAAARTGGGIGPHRRPSARAAPGSPGRRSSGRAPHGSHGA